MVVQVDSGALRAHANTAVLAQEQLSQAADAGSTTVDPMAFGVVNAFLASMASSFCLALESAIRGAGSDLSSTHDNLQVMATSYDTHDADAASGISSAGGSL